MTFDAILAAHTGIVDDLSGTVDANLALLDLLCDEVLSFLDSPSSLHEITGYMIQQKKLFSSNPIKAAAYGRNTQGIVDYLVDIGQVKLFAERGICLYVQL